MTASAPSAARQDPRLADLIDEFSCLEDWEDRYGHVIALGRALAPLPAQDKLEAAKVRGCASQVWLVSERCPDGTIRFRGESDAAIVQGLLAILLRLYSDRRPADILALDPAGALSALGLTEALTPQRSNGVRSMAARIREVAAEAAAA